MSVRALFFLIFMAFPLFMSATLLGAGEVKTIVHSVSRNQMLLLKKVDQKYQKNHGIHLKLKKTIKMAMLGSEKQSTGEIWLDQGQLRLEIFKPDASLIVASKKYLWIETPAPQGFKDAKTQVLKTSLNSSRAKSQGLIQLLTRGGLLKYFRVTGVQVKEAEITYFLQPETQAAEFKRAQIRVNSRKKEIRELKYWDQVDNETTYLFEESLFEQKIAQEKFAYAPPQGAEVITY